MTRSPQPVLPGLEQRQRRRKRPEGAALMDAIKTLRAAGYRVLSNGMLHHVGTRLCTAREVVKLAASPGVQQAVRDNTPEAKARRAFEEFG